MSALTALPVNDIMWRVATATQRRTNDEALGTTVTLPWIASHGAYAFPEHAEPFRALVGELQAEIAEEADPRFSTQWTPVTLACAWDDLARLANVASPLRVLALVTSDIAEMCDGEAELATH